VDELCACWHSEKSNKIQESRVPLWCRARRRAPARSGSSGSGCATCAGTAICTRSSSASVKSLCGGSAPSLTLPAASSHPLLSLCTSFASTRSLHHALPGLERCRIGQGHLPPHNHCSLVLLTAVFWHTYCMLGSHCADAEGRAYVCATGGHALPGQADCADGHRGTDITFSTPQPQST
jgi:hypothetical protein